MVQFMLNDYYFNTIISKHYIINYSLNKFYLRFEKNEDIKGSF